MFHFFLDFSYLLARPAGPFFILGISRHFWTFVRLGPVQTQVFTGFLVGRREKGTATPRRLVMHRRASGKVSNAPSKPFGENWKISRGGSQRNFPSTSIPSIRYSPARVIVSINSLGACFSRFALASLAGPLFFKFSKVLIFSLFRGSLGVRSAAGGRRDPRHPKPKPGSFFVAHFGTFRFISPLWNVMEGQI